MIVGGAVIQKASAIKKFGLRVGELGEGKAIPYEEAERPLRLKERKSIVGDREKMTQAQLETQSARRDSRRTRGPVPDPATRGEDSRRLGDGGEPS